MDKRRKNTQLKDNSKYQSKTKEGKLLNNKRCRTKNDSLDTYKIFYPNGKCVISCFRKGEDTDNTLNNKSKVVKSKEKKCNNIHGINNNIINSSVKKREKRKNELSKGISDIRIGSNKIVSSSGMSSNNIINKDKSINDNAKELSNNKENSNPKIDNIIKSVEFIEDETGIYNENGDIIIKKEKLGNEDKIRYILKGDNTKNKDKIIDIKKNDIDDSVVYDGNFNYFDENENIDNIGGSNSNKYDEKIKFIFSVDCGSFFDISLTCYEDKLFNKLNYKPVYKMKECANKKFINQRGINEKMCYVYDVSIEHFNKTMLFDYSKFK